MKQEFYNMKIRNIFMRLFVLISVLVISNHCDAAGDKLRHIGQQNRQRKAAKLNQQQIDQWQRDLDFNKKQVLELHDNIYKLVQTSKQQGNISWKIARAYMQEHQHEMAAAYMNQALQKKFSKEEPTAVSYDKLLSFLDEALRRFTPEIDLIFDAGLCYANASRVRGWESVRFLAATRLFKEMLLRQPDEGRAMYQLGLMYGKTNNRYRDQPLAIKYLDQLLIKEDKHIPGRFARAHILVEMGQLADARLEYQNIQVQLKSLEQKGVIKNALLTPNFKQASINIEKLDVCINGSPGCELE